MTCAVFTNNKEKARAKLEEIKSIKNNLSRFYETKTELVYIFEDGVAWHWVSVNENRRGFKAKKAYIDNDINSDMLSTIVFPSCAHCENIFYF